MNWSEAKQAGKQFRRFVAVGLVCLFTDLPVYYALVNGLGWEAGWAKAASYLAGVAVGFLLNKRWTFESTARNWTEPATYLSLYAVTLGINVGCNHAVLSWGGDSFRLLAFLFATGVTTVLNFVGLRLVTFRSAVADGRAAASAEIESRPDPRSEAA